MSTRFILIELEDPTTVGGMAKALAICELPTAAELGRVAFKACEEEFSGYETVGESILRLIMGKSNV